MWKWIWLGIGIAQLLMALSTKYPFAYGGSSIIFFIVAAVLFIRDHKKKQAKP